MDGWTDSGDGVTSMTTTMRIILGDDDAEGESNHAYTHADYYDEALKAGCLEYVNKKLCGKFDNYGIVEKSCREVYLTTVDILISFWDQTKTPHDASILDMLKNFVERNNLEFDEDLYEDYYAYFNSKNYDDEGFNRSVTWNLDKIMEKIEDSDNIDSYRKNSEVLEKLSKLKYGDFNEWYEFPPQKTFGEKTPNKFIIKDVDDGKILITYTDYERNEFNKDPTIDSYNMVC